MLAAPTSAAPPTGLSSGNLEYVKTVPLETGFPSGARIVGDRLYIAGAKSFSIYDVSDPVDPQLLSFTPIGFHFPNEDVDTNGKVLLLSNEQGGPTQGLHVWDVRDPAAPTKVAHVAGLRDHTFTCVLDCSWAYGSRGSIVDIRKPAAAKLASSWGGVVPSDGFDVTEVSPGMVLTSTRLIRLMDARRDPTKPRTVALGSTHDNRLIHSNRWPRGGRDRFFLVQGETPFSGVCDDNSGAIMTWDAADWRRTHSFELVDEYRPVNGTFTDGNPPAGATGCTAMWFDPHGDFRNGGLVAAAAFEHGTRILDVGPKGDISEIGWFTPAAGSTIAAYWATDDVVYAIDVTRGLDILRFTGD